MPSDDKIRASRFPRIVVVKQKCPMAAMITRRKNERNTTMQDAIWMATRKAKWTHEFNTKMNLREYLRQFFGMPKILNPHTKLLPKLGKLCRRSNEGWRCAHEWSDAYTITPEFEYFYNRVSICCQNRDSVRPALGISRDSESSCCLNLMDHLCRPHRIDR